MNEFWRRCAEEYREASETFGHVRPPLKLALMVVLTAHCLVAVVVLWALTLALMPLALVVALAERDAPGSDRAKSGGTKPDLSDPWLME
jgi:hypothetical protein